MGFLQILRQLLVLRTQAVWNDVHDFCCCHLSCWWSLFSEYCIRSKIIFSQYRLRVQLDLYSWCFVSQFGILQMTYVHQWSKMNFCGLRPCFIDHLWITFDFCQVPRPNLFQFFPFIVHCCLCCESSFFERERGMKCHKTVRTVQGKNQLKRLTL